MKYMLDTNTIIYAINKRQEHIVQQITQHRPEDICISAITMAELEYGVYHSAKKQQNQLALVTFLSKIEIVPFDTNAALEYGIIRADLTAKGNLIGGNDLLIAAHAKSLGLTLVTNNTREFCRVEGLKIEDWA